MNVLFFFTCMQLMCTTVSQIAVAYIFHGLLSSGARWLSSVTQEKTVFHRTGRDSKLHTEEIDSKTQTASFLYRLKHFKTMQLQFLKCLVVTVFTHSLVISE